MVSQGIWTLRRGERLLGTIDVTDGDFPWLSGTWSPTTDFSGVAPLFATELALLEDDPDGSWEDAYRTIWRAGVRLPYPDGRRVPEFLLHIEGKVVWFRWNDEPFPAGGIEDA